eukprot:TRINITY_DN591_c0_g1_i11.p1 TRINITY_DN591_c0_g1~~TRINITY_DN591_c0_g1_i11.p1  ORF type:complete len:444 (-),score=61.92 TRINITY_DN591_c0_g1_i11:1134-2465(-)
MDEFETKVESIEDISRFNSNVWLDLYRECTANGHSNSIKTLRVVIADQTRKVSTRKKYVLEENGSRVTLNYKNPESIPYYFADPDVKNQAWPPEKKLDSQLVNVHNGDCLDVAIRLIENGYNPVVLNMASDRNPGGGWERGSGAQEESLFRRSNYFLFLHYDYYPIRELTVIYSPNVTVFRASEFEGYKFLENPVEVSFIAAAAYRSPTIHFENKKKSIKKDNKSPAPSNNGKAKDDNNNQKQHHTKNTKKNNKGGGENNEAITQRKNNKTTTESNENLVGTYGSYQIEEDSLSAQNCTGYRMVERYAIGTRLKIENILTSAILNNHDSIVLSAFGCGAFKNPPEHMARIFHQVLSDKKFHNRFRIVVFAIIEDKNSRQNHNPRGNIEPFIDVFRDNTPQPYTWIDHIDDVLVPPTTNNTNEFTPPPTTDSSITTTSISAQSN